MNARILLCCAAALLAPTLTAQTGKKISEWPVATTITGSDVALGNQGGATKQIPFSLLSALYQPLDGDLTAIAALTTTSYGRGLLTGADAAATRVTLGLGSIALLSVPSAGLVLSDGSALNNAILGAGLRLSGSTLSADRVTSLWDATRSGNGLTVDDGGIVLSTTTTALVPNTGGLVIYGFGSGLQLGGGAYKLGFYGATPIDRPGGNALVGLVSLGLMGTATLAASDISSGTLAVARGGTGTSSPALVAGSNISITGTWPNQTINSTASSAWADITGKPTTLAGYGISDAITAAAVASGYQPLDGDLTAIAALTSTSFGRALLELANAAAGRAALGLVVGSDVQAYHANLAAVAGGTYTGATSITTLGTIATGNVPWARLSGTPTTVSGYGISDALAVSGTAAATITLAPGANTVAAGLSLTNATAATSGNQQYSPFRYMEGQGWKTTATAASQSVRFRDGVVPVQGTTAPTGAWTLDSSINGGAFSTAMTVSSAGAITANNAGASHTIGRGDGANANLFWDSNGRAVMRAIATGHWAWVLDSNQTHLRAGHGIAFTGDNSVPGTPDVMIARTAAGRLQFNSGTTDVLRDAQMSHLLAGGTAPTIAAGTGAGTSPTVTIVSGSQDMAGRVSVVTGSSPTAAGVVCTITLNRAYPTGTWPVISPANAAAAELTGTAKVYASGASTTTWTITVASGSLAGSTTYLWNYHVGGY